jgi:tyramine---L-glutamate ligase
MRILVYEYLCSGALAHPAAALAALRREGLAMFRAITLDLALCPGVQLLAPLDPALLEKALPWPGNLTLFPAHGPSEDEALFKHLACQADAALVIAPEFDDLLWQRCYWLEKEGVPSLGATSEAVRLTGDKRRLGQHWEQEGIPTPNCLSLAALAGEMLPFPCVLKPRHGAGSQATFLLHDAADLQRARDQALSEGVAGEFMLQPFVPGRPASAAFLLGPQGCLSLPAAWQSLSTDGRFRYQGGAVPLPVDLNGRATTLARRSIQSIPGLRGYVGVDLILGPADNGSEDYAIEINPRLTTSYVGLRRLARFNLAEAWLGVLGWTAALPKERWGHGSVTFRANGSVKSEIQNSKSEKNS